MTNPIEFCEHDSLKRSCPICDLQEELKEERKLRLQAEQGLHACWEMVKERGKELSEARKERLDYQDWVVGGMRQDAQRYEIEIKELMQERNALLGGLKQIGVLTLDGGITLLPHQALNRIHGITSSTIADLEGSKPNDTPTT